MSPFAFFNITPCFQIDTQALRKLFLANQRKWHPDFHAANPDLYKQALEQTAANNEAYRLLSDTFSRVKCLLSLQDLDAEKEDVLPQTFLMEMMDLSDLIEEAVAGNQSSREEAERQLAEYFDKNQASISALSASADSAYSSSGYPRSILLEAAALYQQNRYLNRLRKNLSGITEL